MTEVWILEISTYRDFFSAESEFITRGSWFPWKAIFLLTTFFLFKKSIIFEYLSKRVKIFVFGTEYSFQIYKNYS